MNTIMHTIEQLVQQFQFQTLEILYFMGVQKLCGAEISRFLLCILQFLDKLWRVFIFSNYIRETNYCTLNLLKKGPICNAGPSEKFLIVDHPKEDDNEREFNHLIKGISLDLLERSSKTTEASNKWYPTLSILDLLKIFSEVIVAPKHGPLARIKKQAMS